MKYNDNGLWKTLNVKVTDTLPVGTIIPYAGATIPSNYMKCEGQELSRIEYDILFSAIGTTYGAGDGTTTFNLPNLKGRVITGIDSNDTDFDTLGETGGEKTHTLTVNEMPSHNHNITYVKSASTPLSSNGLSGYSENNNGVGTNTNAIQNAGGDQAHNNLQPYIVLNYIIKVLDAPAIQAQVVNGYSTSSRDSYSCNYANKLSTYSTDEIRVGTWMGKPLYRKVYILSAVAGNSSYTLNPAPSNVDLMWFDLSSTFLLQESTGYVRQGIDAGAVDPGYDFSARVVSKTSVNIYVGNSIANNSTIYATLLYTKTTD